MPHLDYRTIGGKDLFRVLGIADFGKVFASVLLDNMLFTLARHIAAIGVAIGVAIPIRRRLLLLPSACECCR